MNVLTKLLIKIPSLNFSFWALPINGILLGQPNKIVWAPISLFLIGSWMREMDLNGHILKLQRLHNFPYFCNVMGIQVSWEIIGEAVEKGKSWQ